MFSIEQEVHKGAGFSSPFMLIPSLPAAASPLKEGAGDRILLTSWVAALRITGIEQEVHERGWKI